MTEGTRDLKEIREEGEKIRRQGDEEMTCKHEDGWVLKEEVCIGQDNIPVEVQCNHLGCGFRKFVEIDISEGREVKK